MVDPTSDLGEAVSADDAPNCANCGESTVPAADRRVHTTIVDGAVDRRQFCSEACLDEWRNE
ncbi:hypothetical protein [Halostella sp. PRR32]|uniref:DUF7576 family protein n=1 Tax=Halostella sp. PRR32 TaxID=3098147 RepID=UPI002B1E8DCC|nr:hypothetical protein [Halostella sp. PRR32]